jgi:hypothetical protein
MTHPRFEYDGRTDEPHPPLRNATPLLWLVVLGGVVVLVLLVAGGVLALFRATRPADPGTGKADAAAPTFLVVGAVVGDRPAGRGPVPGRPHPWELPGEGLAGGADAGGRQ